MRIQYVSCFIGALLLVSSCKQQPKEKQPAAADTTRTAQQPEAISLLGDTLYAPELPEHLRKSYETALQVAQTNYQQNPDDLNNIIWLGRRLAYLHHYQAAIEIYTQGIQQFPDAPELYRHRGHRYITTRQFDKAVQDLEKSALLAATIPVTLEPDGISDDHTPSTLQFNIYYHLGLAHYLTGQYGKAAQAYETCLTYCEDEAETAAAADWLYMTYRRLGEDEIAEKTLDMIREDTPMQDTEGYFERILMYKGLIEPDSLLHTKRNEAITDQPILLTTQGYGVGNYYVANGDTEKGLKILQEVVDGRYWVAFGYIAAEADIARSHHEQMIP